MDPVDWEALKKQVKECWKCAIRSGCTQTVFGDGNVAAPVFLVGEAPGCFVAGTPLFLADGPQFLEQPATGLDGVEADLTYAVTDYAGVRFRPKKFPWYVSTADHKLLIATRTKFLNTRLPRGLGNPSFVAAESLLSSTGQHFLLIEKRRHCGEIQRIPIKGEHRRKRDGYNDRLIPEFLEIDEEAAFALGAYMGDGSASLKSGSSTWHFSEGFKEGWVPRLERALSVLGLPVVKRRSGKRINLFVYSRTIASFLRAQFGVNAHEKRVPPFVFQSPPSVISSFLFGWYVADGSKLRALQKGQRIVTVSPQAAWQAVDLGLRCGQLFGVHIYKDRRLRAKNWLPCYSVTIDTTALRALGWPIPVSLLKTSRNYAETDRYFLVRVSKAERTRITGLVYDKTSQSHSYDIPFRVHNSEEDRTGLPFVGPAGQKLVACLKKAGFEDDGLFVSNVLRCRPEGNRTPHRQEIQNCSTYLLKQLEYVNPKVVVALGATATEFFLNKNQVGKLRGQFHRGLGRTVMVTWHPSFVIRTADRLVEAQFVCDLKTAREKAMATREVADGGRSVEEDVPGEGQERA